MLAQIFAPSLLACDFGWGPGQGLSFGRFYLGFEQQLWGVGCGICGLGYGKV
jgi:hypothetical protein